MPPARPAVVCARWPEGHGVPAARPAAVARRPHDLIRRPISAAILIVAILALAAPTQPGDPEDAQRDVPRSRPRGSGPGRNGRGPGPWVLTPATG